MSVELKGIVDKISDKIITAIKDGIAGLRVDQTLIYNKTDKPVTFYVYNYVDTVYWVSAMKVLVAPNAYGIVAASGAFFKIHPDDRKEEEFLVAPSNAYVYDGPGKVSKFEKN